MATKAGSVELKKRLAVDPLSARDEAQRIEIGKTRVTAAGYFMTVASVSFSDGPQRIRLELHNAVGFIRHLDLTTELASDLEPLIRKAGELGRKR